MFCKIVAGEIPSEKIYEDDTVFAFLDIRPVNPGHILLVPKEHYPMMVDTPNEIIQYIFVQAKKLIPIVKTATKCDFVVLSIVGVDVPHFHIHLIPRFHHDGLENFWPHKEYKEGEMKEIGEKIRKAIADGK